YELLTGSTPLSHKRLKEAAYAEILRMIKEEEPQKPSTRLSDSGEALASISANRHTEPAKLTKLVKGELDWIVMKTLEKDRNRRYETANAFAADVQRYLHDEPVQACPPSKRYRLGKFMRRNKVALALVTTVALALVVTVAGLGIAGLLTRQALKDREAALEKASQRSKFARAAADEMYTEVAQEWLADQPQLQLVQKKFLQKAADFYQALAQEDATDPDLRLEAGMAYHRLGRIQNRLGRDKEAEVAYRQAVDLLN